jgi:DNA-binding NtrC family response regulator
MPYFTRLSNASPQLPLLIVDSDREIRTSFTEKLTAKGYEVENAPDGKTCLERIQYQDFGVVLLRSHLPDQDGISLLTAIRFIHPRIPVIFMTSAGPSPIALERGAFAVLLLPCPADEFYDVVQRAISLREDR